MNISTEDMFFSLLRCGLWGKAENGADYASVDWQALVKMAKEQTVIGLVSDGVSVLKHSDVRFSMPVEISRQLMVRTISVERANARLDAVVAELAGIFKDNGISYCLIKGQGTARNYVHPGHRCPGDIDFLLDDENYRRASEVLAPRADKLFPEDGNKKHFGMLFRGGVDVELHGTARASFGKAFNDVIDEMQSELFTRKNFRSWDCLGEPVTLPSVDFDAMFIFTHFIQHFYHGGLGLRQICDWVMHLHRFAPVIDRAWIRLRLDELGLDKEWKAFGFIAVNLLGLPREEMPFYDETFGRYSDMIWASIRHSGNFGRTMNGGRDMDSEPYLLRKLRSLRGHLCWMSRHFSLSPRNTYRAMRHTITYGFMAVMRGQ